MILFEEDWAKYPTAIPDYKSTNESFVRQARVYKSMGIKNYKFLLALIQPELQGVDPHSPNLTAEQKVMIGLECRYNPWYFFREVVRLPPQAGAHSVPLKANRGNIALYFTFLSNIDSALIQPRQTGKSVSTDCLMDWLIYIGASNTTITMITKDNDLRNKNVERLKRIRDLLPKYLVSIMPTDADNKEQLTCVLHSNSYMTGVSQKSEAAANNVGRGLTSPILHCDEGPFIQYIYETLPAALAAGTAARDEARRNGRPHGNIFTTTAGKKDSREGAYMYNMITGGAVWNEVFLDSRNKEQFLETVRLNGSGRKAIVNITMSHRQLGYTDEWLYDAISVVNGTPEQTERDFLNVWTAGSLTSPLSVSLLEKIHASDMDPLHVEVSAERYLMRWYIPESEIAERMAEGQYVIGLDTSEAVGRDTIALVITDTRDLAVVAGATFNETNLIRFASYLANLLIRFPTTTLVIERKSTAAMIIDYLLLRLPKAGLDPFKRMFNRIVDESRENEEAYRELQKRVDSRNEAFYDLRKGKFGFNTNAENRTQLYTTVLQNAAKKAGHLVRDRSLSQEVRGLVTKNGRIDHKTGGHDDHVIAWLLTHWFLTHGRNLQHYGIDMTHLMSEVSDVGRAMSEDELMERDRQTSYVQEIETILDDLKKATNEMIIAKLEHRLRILSLRVVDSSNDDSISIDMLIQQAQEERAKRSRMQARQQQARPNAAMVAYRPRF